MITAADTNVLSDLIFHNERFESQSRAWLEEAQGRGAVVICHVVYAELVSPYKSRVALEEELESLGVTLSPITDDIAYEAGLRWSRYRHAGGPRTRSSPTF